ncbi:MAG: substrate-binding domain-containing protein [Firmicutes bacterium]|nr:substrate-binding domain-containing protein [Bacillota bacterium]
MKKRKKRIRIGYFNQILGEYWSFPPWLGAVETARKYDVDLISFYGNAILDQENYKEQGNILYDLAKGGKLDGLIIWKGHFSANLSDEEFLAFCQQYCIPFVTIEGSFPGYPSVTYGNYSGMRMVVKHLIETHGYKKIGFVGIDVENETHEVFQDRYRAYYDTMQEYGLPVDPDWVKPWRPWEDLYGRPPGELLDEWLQGGVASELEAIIGISDPTAIWVMEHLEKLGFSVPYDLAVAGFDNSSAGKSSILPLTTVDPSWTELGRATIKVLLDILDGKPVPEKTEVEAHLVVARTCGCREENIALAGGYGPKNPVFTTRKKRIVSEINKVLGEERFIEPHGPAAELLDALLVEAESGRGLFLNRFEKILKSEYKAGKNLVLWQDVISLLQNLAVPAFLRGKARKKADILCRQARVMAANMAIRAQENRWGEMEKTLNRERQLGLGLITTFDLNQLMDLLAESLPALGISGFYVSLYENPVFYCYPAPVPETSRLVLAYNDQGRVELEPGGLRYRSREVVPEELWPEDRAVNFSVHPLYFQQNQIGFIVFDAVPRKLDVFDTLRIQLSSALQGVFLVNKIEEQMRDLAKANVQLEQSYRDLQENQQRLIASEKMASLGRLSAGIAHEMNTPLATVRAALLEIQLLAEEYEQSIDSPQVEPADHHEIAREILKNTALAMRAAERSAGFIRGMKAQTHGQLGKKKELFNAAAVAEDVFVVLEHQFKKNKCVLHKELAKDLSLYGDPQAFSQILVNLLVNAIDACKGKPGEIRVLLTEDLEEKTVDLRVIDNGAGISKENMTKIFDPFFTTKSFGEGTGLGLSIVYDLVKEFNGNITVDSVPGRTEFSIRFPGKKGIG